MNTIIQVKPLTQYWLSPFGVTMLLSQLMFRLLLWNIDLFKHLSFSVFSVTYFHFPQGSIPFQYTWKKNLCQLKRDTVPFQTFNCQFRNVLTLRILFPHIHWGEMNQIPISHPRSHWQWWFYISYLPASWKVQNSFFDRKVPFLNADVNIC